MELKDLSDINYQEKKWVNSRYSHSFWDELQMTIILLEDAFVFAKPETQIGYLFKNQAEVSALIPLADALTSVLHQIGTEKPDSSYINSPLWCDVVRNAKHAYEVMMEDEDLDDLLKAEEKRH